MNCKLYKKIFKTEIDNQKLQICKFKVTVHSTNKFLSYIHKLFTEQSVYQWLKMNLMLGVTKFKPA